MAICRLLLLLATLSIVPLRTKASVEQIQGLVETILDVGKAATEYAKKGEDSSSKFTKAVHQLNEAASKHDKYQGYIQGTEQWFHDKFQGGGGGFNGVVRSIRTGYLAFTVAEVDVADAVTTTTGCDAATQGRFNKLIKGPLTLLDAAQPPHAAAAVVALYSCVASQGQGGARIQQVATLGLGRSGALPARYGSFSYLLTSTRLHYIVLGGVTAQARLRGRPTTTIRLINNIRHHPDRYYVRVTAILVNGNAIPASGGALELDPSTGAGGVYMRSSSVQPWTSLTGAVYRSLVQEFQSHLLPAAPVPGVLHPEQLCYTDASLANAVIPPLALVFDDGRTPVGAVMQLQKYNYWNQQSKNGVQCLAILPSSTQESVLGSQLQWGWQMTYDLTANVLQATLVA